MNSGSTFLNESLRDVFSLVPTDVALSASREVMVQYEGGVGAISSSIVWCDFRQNGNFLRAGVSDVGLMETRSVLTPNDHPVITEIVQYASKHRLQAGTLIPSELKSGFHWCIPYMPPTENKQPTGGFRTLLITEELFREVFDLFNIENQLTPAEKRSVYQLVSGLNPTQAAKSDNVSVETKRSHLKRAMSKLHCSSQSEIMRMMVSQMIHVLYLCESETSQNRVIEAFTMEHLHGSVRLSSQRLPSGRLQRVWEMGPADGKPLLVLHGVLFPFMMLNAHDHLERLGVRLVIPVRNGYLDDQANTRTFQEGRLVEQTMDDLEEFIRLTWSGPIDVLCHASGAFYAMFLSRRTPDLFSRIVVISINLMKESKTRKSYASSFLGGIRKLAKHNGVHEMLVRQFQKTTFSNDRATRFVLRRLFRESATDLDAVNGVLGYGDAFKWYQALHAASMIGIASDFNVVNIDAGEVISDIKVPILFLHGPNDCFTSLADMREYADRNANAVLRVLPKGGHLAIASHPDLFWPEIETALK